MISYINEQLTNPTKQDNPRWFMLPPLSVHIVNHKIHITCLQFKSFFGLVHASVTITNCFYPIIQDTYFLKIMDGFYFLLGDFLHFPDVVAFSVYTKSVT